MPHMLAQQDEIACHPQQIVREDMALIQQVTEEKSLVRLDQGSVQATTVSMNTFKKNC